jgi:hypothetical protein
MGRTAYVYAASVARPMDQLLNRLAREFSLLSRVLRGVKPSHV